MHRKSGTLLIFCAAVFCAFPHALRAAAQAPQYDIEAALDTQRHAITASEAVTVPNNSSAPVSEISFNIFPHRKYKNGEIKFIYSYGGYFKVDPYPEGFQPGDLRVLAASGAGNKLEFAVEGADRTILTVKLAQPLAPGASVTIRLDFEVDIPHAYGRFGWHKGIIALNRWYPMLVVVDDKGSHKYPCYLYHHPYYSDAALYTLKLTLPKGETAACSAALKERRENPDGTETLRFETGAPCRDLSLGVSRRFLVYSLQAQGLTINSYYLAGDEARAKQAAEDARQLIAYDSAKFFAYPYPEFSIVPCYLGYGGENSSAFIFIDTRVYRLPSILNRYFDFLISHETGHQWFYNAVGSDEYKEMFLDEGVNSYWTIRYLEDKYGYNAVIMELPRFLKPFIRNFSFRDSAAIRYLYMAKNGLDRPVIGELSSFQEPSSIFALAYGKGQAILDMLDRMVGREAFDRAMKRYAERYKFGNASLGDLAGAFSEEAGRDLGWFFDEWLTTKKTCDYAVKRVDANAVVLENRGEALMPVLTRLTFSDGSLKEDSWDGAGKEHVIPAGKKVSRVEVDPDNAIGLDIDRTNNFWPGKTTFRPVAMYNFSHELPMMLDRSAYNVVAGPALGSESGLAASVQKPFSGIGKLTSLYDFNGKAVDTRLNYELRPTFGKQAALGFELFDYNARTNSDDLQGGKLYYRRELWPANFGLFDTNDHVTFYLLHDRKFDSSDLWAGQENVKEHIYTRTHESIVGMAGSLARCGPYPDPDYGWKLMPVQEFGGHFLGGEQAFWRSSLELDNYILVWPRYNHKIATRLSGGWGGPADKQLFQLGGAEDLRGYRAKSVDGSRMLMGSVEYRLPLARTLAVPLPFNLVNLDAVQLAAFFDCGKAWDSGFSSQPFRKDAGLGLRFLFDTIGFLEKTVLRVDAARPVNDHSDHEWRFWFELSQPF